MVFHDSGPSRSQERRVSAIPSVIRCLLIGAATCLSGGCASHGTVLPSSSVNLIVAACEHIDLSARLFDLQGDLHLHGTVRSRGFRSGPGYVDVEVRDSGGEVWAHDGAYFRLDHRPRIGPGPAFINLTLQGLPPLGSTVEVRHHHESRSR